MLVLTTKTDKRSQQKQAALTKLKGPLLFKWLVAFCVLDNVGATAAASTPLTSTSPTCGCTEEIATLQEKIDTMEVAHAAEKEAVRQEFDQKLDAVYRYVAMVPPSSPPSAPPSPPSPSPPPPSPSPPPPSPSPPP
eukprot:scaffold78699_cov64-Phaeocystis_antarctica.AAC.1